MKAWLIEGKRKTSVLLLCFLFLLALLSPPLFSQETEASGEANRRLSRAEEARLKDPVGVRLVELGNFEEAADHYRELLRKRPDDVSACIGLGYSLCQMKKFVEALQVLGDCIARMPTQADLYLERGNCVRNIPPDGFAQAIKDYEKAIEFDPRNAAAHNQLGLIYQAQGNHEKAAAEFQKALALDPDLLAAYNNLGASMLALGKAKEAISLFQQAVSRKPDQKGYHFYQNLGLAYLYAGDWGRAEASLLLELANNPSNLNAMINLGNLYAMKGRYDLAAREYHQVLIKDPNARQALVNLGAVLSLSGKHETAVQLLEKAVSLYPDSALAHFYLAESYRALGREAEAEREKIKARELGYNPNTTFSPRGP